MLYLASDQNFYHTILSYNKKVPFHHRPNPALNSDPACIVFRSLSAPRFLGSAHRLGAGGAG